MATRPSHKRNLEFESMERRETPAALGLVGPQIHELASSVKAASLTGNGKSVQTSMVVDSDGFVHATSSLSGKSNRIGKFTGTLSSTFSADLQHSFSTAELVAANGNRVTFALDGTYKAGKKGHETALFAFSITGGTGKFTGASGTGTLNATINLTNGSSTFTFKGKFTTS